MHRALFNISFCSLVDTLMKLGQKCLVIFRNIERSEAYFWQDRMKWVCVSGMYWQDLQNLRSIFKGGLKCRRQNAGLGYSSDIFQPFSKSLLIIISKHNVAFSNHQGKLGF